MFYLTMAVVMVVALGAFVWWVRGDAIKKGQKSWEDVKPKPVPRFYKEVKDGKVVKTEMTLAQEGQMYGLWNAKGQYWAGDETGPSLWPTFQLAFAAGAVLWARIAEDPSKRNPFMPRIYDGQPLNPGLEVETQMTTGEALKKIEGNDEGGTFAKGRAPII